MLAWQAKGRSVLVVGGGHVAAGRILNALEADAKVTVIAPHKGLLPEVVRRIDTGQIASYKDKEFDESDLDDVDLCFVAIDSPEVSSRIWRACKERRIPVNVADVPAECDFYFGSQHRDGPLQIMISTNGTAPKLANLIRMYIAQSLPRNAGNACQNVGRLRRKLRAIAPGPSEVSKRMKWFDRVDCVEADCRMVEVCEKYTLDQLVRLTHKDMDRLLLSYGKGEVPAFWKIHEEKPTWEFDGSFGWHC
jgi:precorrin-2 dehydrogenase / sirohydrochlorin ferrochelatase